MNRTVVTSASQVIYKQCPGCHKRKPLTEFGKDKSRKYDAAPYCVICAKRRGLAWSRAHRNAQQRYRAANREKIIKYLRGYRKLHPQLDQEYNLKKYGLTVSAYKKLLVQQNRRCAICRTTKPGKRNRVCKLFTVDHNHKTGKVRGLLCSRCNLAIGLFDDNVVLLSKATNYLESRDG